MNIRDAQSHDDDNFKRYDGSLKTNVTDFITDEYLQFHQMHPEDVTLFYAPVIQYNGKRNVLNELAIRDKFRSFRRWPELELQLIQNSLRIRERQSRSEIYDVSFVYKVKYSRFNNNKWIKKKVELTLDLNMDDVQIQREKIHVFDRPYS